jgi:hypothetical protein
VGVALYASTATVKSCIAASSMSSRVGPGMVTMCGCQDSVWMPG